MAWECPLAIKPIIMWKKFISSKGNLCLTKREVLEDDVKEIQFWFRKDDKDFDQGLALAERLGL
jgi:hypothetical protein